MQSTCLTSEARCATLCHDGLEHCPLPTSQAVPWCGRFLLGLYWPLRWARPLRLAPRRISPSPRGAAEALLGAAVLLAAAIPAEAEQGGFSRRLAGPRPAGLLAGLFLADCRLVLGLFSRAPWAVASPSGARPRPALSRRGAPLACPLCSRSTSSLAFARLARLALAGSQWQP